MGKPISTFLQKPNEKNIGIDSIEGIVLVENIQCDIMLEHLNSDIRMCVGHFS